MNHPDALRWCLLGIGALFITGASLACSPTTPTSKPPAPQALRPAAPKRDNPEEHTSACKASRLDLKELEIATSAIRQALIADALRSACGDHLPKPLESWLSGVNGWAGALGTPRPIAPGSIEGLEPYFKRACPAGLDTLKPSKTQDWGERMDTLYQSCGFDALGLATQDEFRRSSGPEAGAMAMVLYAWMVDDGVQVSLARTYARSLVRIEAPALNPAYEPLGAPVFGAMGELAAWAPKLTLTASANKTLEIESSPTVVIQQKHLWSVKGHQLIDEDELGALKALAPAGSPEPRYQNYPLQFAVSPDTSFKHLKTVAGTVKSYKSPPFTIQTVIPMKLLVGSTPSLAQSGQAVAADEWQPLRVFNVIYEPVAQGNDRPLVVDFTPKGYMIRLNGSPQPPIKGCPADGPTVCRKGKASEVRAALYATLSAIKQQHPQEDFISLKLQDDTTFAELVQLIDAVSYLREASDGTPVQDAPGALEASRFKTCPKEDAFQSCAHLFPNIALLSGEN